MQEQEDLEDSSLGGKVTVRTEGAEARWWLPHVVLLCCQCAFAVMHISSHGALEYIPPLPYSAMRVTLALPLLFAGAAIKVHSAACLSAACPARSQRLLRHLSRSSNAARTQRPPCIC